ncbi:TetR/AcrR family transcriptional regulator [Actinoplanes sp. N902-109]|uniref:TetR/AcrR family transcriptional regulator n=1 Tax=Actinoplanes sp. (strain N902-109) TaxID=649831 RepID=UPI00032955E7|nr:TetR/AcrR family transcriptional regulator [Actinoplanes sp. N902-109]AGL17722.1 putative TetR transcriptional regulator [Actinoplanes sp. N902-109]
MSRKYHHGDLPAALLRASFDLLAECGAHRFSVAAVARRLGVSTAAPYRHFPTRDHLLAAVSTAAARDLTAEITARAEQAGDDPAARFAAAAAAYVAFAGRTGAGFDVIFAAGLEELHDHERTDATRALMTLLVDLAAATGPRPAQDTVRLVEEAVALAHGYTTLYRDGFFRRGPAMLDELGPLVTRAARKLID